MFRRYRRAIVQKSEERIFLEKVFDRNIRRPPIVVCQSQDKLCFWFDRGEFGDLAGGNTSPDIVEPGPTGDAMKVGIDLHRWQLHELVKRELQRPFDQAVDFKLPRRQID